MIGPLLRVHERNSYAPRTRAFQLLRNSFRSQLFTYRSVLDFAFVLIKPAEWQARAQASIERELLAGIRAKESAFGESCL